MMMEDGGRKKERKKVGGTKLCQREH